VPLHTANPIRLLSFSSRETQKGCYEKKGWYNPSRGEFMLNLSKVVRQLKQERDQTRAKLRRLETALKVLEDVGTAGRNSAPGRAALSAGRRTMSAAARKRIAAAQRARWAKWKASQKKK
jgi:hypothetical protein